MRTQTRPKPVGTIAQQVASHLPIAPPTARAKCSARPTEPASVCPSDKGLTELWLGMIGAFGHKWTSSHGELPVERSEEGARSLTKTGAIWQRGLFGCDDAMVRRGFETCIQRPDEWPPSLPTFRRMALGIP